MNLLDLSPSSLKEIQSYVKALFTTGQSLIQSYDLDSNGKDEVNSLVKNSSPGNAIFNRFKLLVLTNAVCVDILVWAAKDEQGKSKFLQKGQDYPKKWNKIVSLSSANKTEMYHEKNCMIVITVVCTKTHEDLFDATKILKLSQIVLGLKDRKSESQENGYNHIYSAFILCRKSPKKSSYYSWFSRFHLSLLLVMKLPLTSSKPFFLHFSRLWQFNQQVDW